MCMSGILRTRYWTVRVKTTTTNRKILNPYNRESATGMTFGTALYLDGLITTQRNNYDWESIGKVMYSDAGFKGYMLTKHPESAEWLSASSSMEVMERFDAYGCRCRFRILCFCCYDTFLGELCLQGYSGR